MISLNISIDFELGWGDLGRLSSDEVFYNRVKGGLQQIGNIVEALQVSHVSSTWGIVGGCCCSSLDDLFDAAPQVYQVVKRDLQAVASRRDLSGALFCNDVVKEIAKSPYIEVGSHSFFHLVPTQLEHWILRDDVAASIKAISGSTGKQVSSFIPPQNYYWPDEAFAATTIRYVRHTPSIFGYEYSQPCTGAKLSRLWNDLVAPAGYRVGKQDNVYLFFLRVDRGSYVWQAQVQMFRRLLKTATGSVFCYIHPHNLDKPLFVQRFKDFCAIVADAREKGMLSFCNFFRELL